MKSEIKNFYDLETWQKADDFVFHIYTVTKNFPKEEIFGLTSQIRRAAISITANIAEGFERYHFKDKIRFYHQARASLGEVQNFLFIAKRLTYTDQKTYGNFTHHHNFNFNPRLRHCGLFFNQEKVS